MTIKLSLPAMTELKPRITVVGVGGAGGNAVNNMISAQLDGVEFVVANTDAQALSQSLTDHRIQIGINVTQGLGAGSNPAVGAQAAECDEGSQQCGEGDHRRQHRDRLVAGDAGHALARHTGRGRTRRTLSIRRLRFSRAAMSNACLPRHFCWKPLENVYRLPIAVSRGCFAAARR